MTIFLYIISSLLIIAGLSIFTKSRNRTTAKMGGTEHTLISLCFIAGGVSAIAMSSWWPILIGVGFAWVLYGVSESKRRRERPSLSPSDYDNSEAVDQFLEWWLSRDAQVREVRKRSIEIIWSEGYRPTTVGAHRYSDAEDYFRTAFRRRLVQLQSASEQELISELKKSGDQSFALVQEAAAAGKEVGIDFDNFDYDWIDSRVENGTTLGTFKQAFLSETLLSNQRRLLMWLFHERFDKWYTPQGSGGEEIFSNVVDQAS